MKLYANENKTLTTVLTDGTTIIVNNYNKDNCDMIMFQNSKLDEYGTLTLGLSKKACDYLDIPETYCTVSAFEKLMAFDGRDIAKRLKKLDEHGKEFNIICHFTKSK